MTEEVLKRWPHTEHWGVPPISWTYSATIRAGGSTAQARVTPRPSKITVLATSTTSGGSARNSAWEMSTERSWLTDIRTPSGSHSALHLPPCTSFFRHHAIRRECMENHALR